MHLLFNRFFERTAVRYGLAAVAVAAAVALHVALQDWVGPDIPMFLTYYPAVMLAAVVGGLWPGLVATGISALVVDYYFLPPYRQFALVELSDTVTLVFFALMGVLMSVVCERLRVNLKKVAAYQAEQAAWESRAKLEAALGSMTDAVYICDSNGQLIHANEAFYRYHRIANREQAPQTAARYHELLEVRTMDGAPVPADMRTVPRALRGETATNVEYRIRRKDTGESWLGSYSFNPVRDSEGRITGAVVVAHDITHRVEAQKRIEQLNRVYSVLSEVNETIVRVKNSQAMLETVCRIAVDKGKFRMAWVGMIDPLAQELRQVTSSGTVDGYFEYVKVDLRNASHASGPSVRCVHTGEHALCNDIEHDPLFSPWREAALARGYRSSGGFPLKVDGAVVGVLNLYASEAGFFTGEELKLLDEMAMDISFALEVNLREAERVKAEAHVRQLNRVYSVLCDVNQTIVREKDSQKMLQAACRIATEKGKFPLAWIGMADAATHRLNFVATSGAVEGYLDQLKLNIEDVQAPGGPVERVFHSGENAICNDIEHELNRPWRGAALQHGFRSIAAFPLRFDGKVIGNFNFYSSEVGFFDKDEIKLLDEMAMDISFALEVNRGEAQRVKAEAHVRRLNRVYSVLSDVNETIVRINDTQKMLEACCEIAVEKGRFRMAWVGKADESGRVLIPSTWSGVVDGYLDSLQIDAGSAEHQDGPVGRSILSGVHAICNDIASDPGFLTKRAAEERGYRSCGAFPLHLEGKVWGALVLYSSEPGFFDEDELKLLDEMAMDISFALEVNRHEQERREGEEELRRRTALFEAQVESSLDGVLVVDGTGKKILQNQRVIEMFHIPAEVVADTDDQAQRRYVGSLIKAPEQFQTKVDSLNAHADVISRDEIELLDGMIYERYSSPILDKAEKYYGRIWTFRDITERRKQEENLRQSQKMEALGQLSGGIAHDFNNILTVILGCGEFLGEEVKLDERLHRMAEMIVDAARRGADVTRRMLAFARRQSLQPKAIDVNRLLAGIESFLRRALTSEIDLEVVARERDCVAIADRSQLENALLNLCVNARDAMLRGGKLIVEVSKRVLDADYAAVHPDVEPGEYVLIDVTDTGTGISPENLSKVFDPFFTTKEAGKGTGLGLSMVYGFVKQSHGHVRVYSELGHGTSVKLYLPRAKEAAGEEQKRVPKIEELRGSETILLVEDDAAVREYATAQLKSLGYTVLEASNGKEALRQLEGHAEIDMLFTDIVMPGGMDGCELGRQAQALRPTLAVLHCSGYAESAFARHGALDEDIEVLSKPYTRLEVAERIRKVLEKGQR